MKIILLKDVKGVGKRFEEKEVSNGHATNFLIPKKLAVASAGSSAAMVKRLREEEERTQVSRNKVLQENIAKLSSSKLEIKRNANEQGSLFEKINAEKISHILKDEQGIEIDPSTIILEHPIKETGTFEIPVSLGEGKQTSFTLEVSAL